MIRNDKLDQKTNLKFDWIASSGAYRLSNRSSPRQAETLVNYMSGSIVAGGVKLDLSALFPDAAREPDKNESMLPFKMRPDGDNWSVTRQH